MRIALGASLGDLETRALGEGTRKIGMEAS